MANIKKAYVNIIALLQDNEDAQVADILPRAIELASAKSGGGNGRSSTFVRDSEGNIIAVKCFYFKRWMNPADVAFGAKKSSASGLSSMCKEGVSLWTKQQRAFAKGKEQALADVMAGDITADELPNVMAELEEARTHISSAPELSFDTLEELCEHYGFDVAA